MNIELIKQAAYEQGLLDELDKIANPVSYVAKRVGPMISNLSTYISKGSESLIPNVASKFNAAESSIKNKLIPIRSSLSFHKNELKRAIQHEQMSPLELKDRGIKNPSRIIPVLKGVAKDPTIQSTIGSAGWHAAATAIDEATGQSLVTQSIGRGVR